MADESLLRHVEENYQDYTLDMFMMNMSAETEEIDLFAKWLEVNNDKKINSFEAVHQGNQGPEVDVVRVSGESFHLLNYSSYNYLGLSYHPEVIKAAQDAVAKHGLGASSSPVISGTYSVHSQLEKEILDYFDLPNRGISLFTSGYGVNLGVVQAFIKPGNIIILDEAAHASLVDGAQLCGGKVIFFKHNDMVDLESKLKEIDTEATRVLICSEGLYSAEGDEGDLRGIVKLAKQYGAFTLVDEAHSVLLAGENGKGVCEKQGVLEEIDLYAMTFSKAFGGIGGAVITRKEIAAYINWFAKCRMFSCALDPAVTGGMVKAVKIAKSAEGAIRRKRIKDNAKYFRSLMQGKVNLGEGDAWIVSVLFGEDKKTGELNNFLQHQGLDTSILQFPAVPRNQGRIRMFLTSEHSKEQMDKAASIILESAKVFNFHI